MSKKEKLLACFTPDELTPKFRALLDLYFEENIIPCVACELHPAYGGDGLQHTFTTAELHARNKHRFVVLGQATHTGSEYLLLRPETPCPVDEWPVVVSGDEGGVAVLAQNLDDWLRFLTLNAQPYVSEEWEHDATTGTFIDKGVSFEIAVAQEEDEETEDNAAYTAWLSATFGLLPITSPEQAEIEVIGPARQHYQAEVDHLIKGETTA